MRIESADLDLGNLQVFPGFINAHDHLQFALFPRLGAGPYANATEWARDIYHPEEDPIREQLLVPKHLRLIWGGLRNLLCGVTTVSHHDPYDPIFDSDFPVRVVKRYGWAHSFAFTKDVQRCFEETPAGAPFLIHLAEGTDSAAAEEIFRLAEFGAIGRHTVLIHAVGLTPEGWDLVKRAGASVIWCPRSNLFTLGWTLTLDAIRSGVPLALGTDSPITAEGDLLDEIRFARESFGLSNEEVCELVTSRPREILRLPAQPDDWIAAEDFGSPPELAVCGGRIRLIAPRLADALPPDLRRQFHPLRIAGRPRVLVRWKIQQLLQDTRQFLGHSPIRLGGREVLE
ncbi:MAG TPA: hypothetical protein VFW83_10780 [Bryobacteraceae bacterium]|nr:hypothetical protein [Bryobacteraceae bacterium]